MVKRSDKEIYLSAKKKTWKFNIVIFQENDEYKICLHAVALSTRPALIKTIWLIQFRNKRYKYIQH